MAYILTHFSQGSPPGEPFSSWEIHLIASSCSDFADVVFLSGHFGLCGKLHHLWELVWVDLLCMTNHEQPYMVDHVI